MVGLRERQPCGPHELVGELGGGGVGRGRFGREARWVPASALEAGDQQVQAVSKATITSKAICRIVNRAAKLAKTAAAADKTRGDVTENQ